MRENISSPLPSGKQPIDIRSRQWRSADSLVVFPYKGSRSTIQESLRGDFYHMSDMGYEVASQTWVPGPRTLRTWIPKALLLRIPFLRFRSEATLLVGYRKR